MATNTAPRQWMDEPDEMLATVLDIFHARAEQIRRHR